MDVWIMIFLGAFLPASSAVGYDTIADERQPVTYAPNRHLYPAENEFLRQLEEAQKDLVTKGITFVMQTSKNTTDILSSITPSQFATLQVIRSLASGDVGISGMLISTPIFGNNTEMDWLDRYFQFDSSLVYDIAKTTCEITGASEKILNLVMMLSQKYEVLNRAAEEGNDKLIKCLLASGINLTETGPKAVVTAWSKNRPDAVSLLLENNALNDLRSMKNIVKVTNSRGQTLLHFAGEKGLNTLANTLIDNGAQVDAKDNDFLTTFYLAVENKHKELARLLLSHGANSSTKTLSGDTLLHLAAKKRSDEAVRGLLEFGPDLEAKNEEGITALYFAAEAGDQNIIDMLLKAGANPQVETNSGNSLLHVAAMRGNFNAVKHLLKSGAEINRKNREGLTPLFLAAENGTYKVIQFLLYKGATCKDLQSEDTLLHTAASRGNLRVITSLIDQSLAVDSINRRGLTPLYSAAEAGEYSAMDLLLSEGSDMYVTLGDGRRLLHVAAAEGNVVAIESLLHIGTYVDVRDVDGLTPLCRAVQADNLVSSGFLIDKGANTSFRSTSGNSLLHIAAASNSYECTQLLIEHGLPIDAENEQNETALYIAAQNKNKTLADLLIALGANKNYFTKHGDSLVHIAAVRNQLEVLKYFANVGSDMNAVDSNGFPPLYCAISQSKFKAADFLLEVVEGLYYREEDTLLHLAARNGEDRVVSYFVNKGYYLDIKDSNGTRPVDLALRNGHCDVALMLLKKGADINGRNGDKRTVLHEAVGGKCTSIFSELIEKVNGFDPRDYKGQTPLHLAAFYGETSAAGTLRLLGADLNAQDSNSDTPGQLAVRNRHWNTFNTLLNSRTKIHFREENNRTVLHLAVLDSQYSIIDYLHSKTNIDVNALDENEQTPLHLASLNGRTSIAEKLIEIGANLNTRDINGKQPIWLAAENNHWDIVLVLAERRADVTLTDENNRSLLHLASLHGETGVVKSLLSWFGTTYIEFKDVNLQTPLHLAALNNNHETINVLLNYGADWHAEDNQDMTPLILAVSNNSWDAVYRLLDKEVEVDWVDDLNRTLLHLASLQGKTAVIDRIFSLFRNTNVNVRDANLQTPLHLAALKNNYNAIDVLLNYGADRHIVDYQNRTPLIVAVTNNNWDVVQRLLDNEIEVDWVDTSNRTLLHLALMNKRVRIFYYLIKNSIFNLNSRDVNHQTVLHLAAIRNYPSICDILVSKGANKSLLDAANRTPLILAATNNSWDAVYTLLDKNVDIEWSDRHNRTLFHLAAQEGQTDIVEYLIENTKININIRDTNLQTPLHLAAVNNQNQTVEFLLKNGADKDLLDNNNNSALIAAVFNSSWDAACSLLNPNGNMEWTDSKNRTLLHLAAMGGGGKLIDCLLKNAKIYVNSLDANGETALDLLDRNVRLDIAYRYSYIDWRDGKDRTLLHLITQERWYNNFFGNYNWLDSMEPYFDSVDVDLRTPLHMAVLNDNCRALEELLYYGKSPNAKDINGQTPLHIAAANGQRNIIETIFADEFYVTRHGRVSNPAKLKIIINSRDNLGRTPLQLSLDNGHKESAAILKKHGGNI